jgi:hypothetical protein
MNSTYFNLLCASSAKWYSAACQPILPAVSPAININKNV